MLTLSALALLAGFALDLLLGDPQSEFHLIRLFGRVISGMEARLRPRFPATPEGEQRAGVCFVLAVLAVCGALPSLLLYWLYRLLPAAGFVLETLIVYQLLATRDLRDESRAVYDRLNAQDLPGARTAVSRIVGRDTDALDEAGVARAAVETVAENTGDGVIAPMFFLLLGGAGLGCFYKAVNTMDSMVGYKNERYLWFGRAAARLDDAANYLPARLAALLLILAAGLGGFDRRNALRIWKRDRRNHASPNSAQTEAAVAGALGLRLAGGAYYFGKFVKKPYIGDPLREIEPSDILRAHKLLYRAAYLMLALCLLARGAAILLSVLCLLARGAAILPF